MTPISSIADPKERLLAFARERHAIYLRKQAGTPVRGPGVGETASLAKVWTTDPILREYRFCNVYRELDTTTRWISDNWRSNDCNVDLWFAMVVARFVNWVPTLREIIFPVPWDSDQFTGVMAHIKTAGRKAYGGAYMIRANSSCPGEPTAVYQARDLFGPLWAARKRLRPKAGDTLNSYHMLLGQFHGLGSFMTAQVVADLKYVSPLREASDWWTFAASGPGSRRGLNRVLDRPKNAPWREDEWRMENERLRLWFNERWEYEPLHGQDLNNLECEMDKFERVRLGEGRPRAKYHP